MRELEGGVRAQGWGPYPEASFPNPLARPTARGYRPPEICRPPVADNAILWKELHVEPGIGTIPKMDRAKAKLALGVGAAVLILCLLPAEGKKGFAEFFQPLVRTASMVLTGFICVIVGLNSAGRVSREVERDTLTGLLALPISTGSILLAKWLGSIQSPRTLWLMLAIVWGAGGITGAVDLFALPLLVGAVLVYVGFTASLGLCLSTLYRNSLRASLLSLLITLVVLIGSTVFYSLQNIGALMYVGSEYSPDWLLLLRAHGLSPLTGLWVLTCKRADLLPSQAAMLTYLRIVAVVAGAQIYILLSAVLLLTARARLDATRGPRPRRPAGWAHESPEATEPSALAGAGSQVHSECEPYQRAR